MADIKFMDISENNNPATTDSILVGNKHNGLKRTSLGNLADMFAVHGLFHIEQLKSLLKKQTDHYEINAPTVEGYRFAFWLAPTTIGWMGATYIERPDMPSSAIWMAYPQGDELDNLVNGNNSVSAFAVYIKNSVA
ncbi:hypothetical protein [Lactobacillus crispatus]|uniref:hypothetical protein n=1 Tax=Lactobacillus crispatus TaxID=47770 RepID=UPI000B5DB5C2|nr:hypothetical protein [Lactobacillus crispatus]OXC15453.1 hypothetical protein AYP78_04220 [Lactobacillus crispatus]OXC16732.1 hypothetical protein AYP79_08910 [Lactobacillus crispatus]OXC16958.1 hypothetical protein AYP80_03105 [Lactobacillus crispatus]OXC26322.1 hypothetical protein AYP84_01125 [Lactobacillus crispatus]